MNKKQKLIEKLQRLALLLPLVVFAAIIVITLFLIINTPGKK